MRSFGAVACRTPRGPNPRRSRRSTAALARRSRCVRSSGRRTCSSSPGCCSAAGCSTPTAIARAAATFAIFCALSGAVYLFNDVADRDGDRRHPLKRSAPDRVGRAVADARAVAAARARRRLRWPRRLLIRPLLGVVAAAYLALLLSVLASS